MSDQTLFDQAVTGLAQQGFRKSVSDDGACMFRGPGGMKCAIGHTVEDSEVEYWPEPVIGPDGKPRMVENVTKINLAACSKYFVAMEFLDNLQQAHDSSQSPSDMRRRLCQVAIKYGLKIPSYLAGAP